MYIWHSPCTQEEIDNIDLKTAQALHKAYWAYIYALGLLYKPIIADSYDNFINVPNDCFACGYAYKVDNGINRCHYCPIKKYRQMKKENSGLLSPCTSKHEPFKRFCNSLLPYKDRVEAALEVVNLEFITEEDNV